MKTIYCYPFTEINNQYVNKNIEIWRRLGYAVEACPKWPWNARFGRRSQKIVILNWFEDWMLNNPRPQWVSVVRALLSVLTYRVMAGRLIWVRHNFKPHFLPQSTPAHAAMLKMLAFFSDVTVTHREVSSIRSQVVPHPLMSMPENATNGSRDIPFLWFGAIHKYKQLDQLLLEWPREKPLLILGRARDAELIETIERTIRDRNLDVVWKNAYVPDEELDESLSRTQCVILAHADNTMIVSGAYFHAVSRGANVLLAESGFSRAVASGHPGVTAYAAGQLAQALAQWTVVPAAQVMQEAERRYGDAACAAAWQQVFD
ncbi:hypothetical protein [Derxia lacustris]|uniref:hypothetical protein n=1 Tax=Derxia lacustris TaxID=764842 RepID=UPI001592EBF2|nr:hypothetical protein [Derxia lacustris]